MHIKDTSRCHAKEKIELYIWIKMYRLTKGGIPIDREGILLSPLSNKFITKQRLQSIYIPIVLENEQREKDAN